MTTSLLIVTDRGSLKAYAVENTPYRGHFPRLLETFQIAEAHERYRDKVTDQAGGFSAGGTTRQGNAAAERTTIEVEGKARIVRQIADHMASLFRHFRPEQWSFAAPPEINGAILDELSPEMCAHLKSNLPRDLTKIEPIHLLAHFEPAVFGDFVSRK